MVVLDCVYAEECALLGAVCIVMSDTLVVDASMNNLIHIFARSSSRERVVFTLVEMHAKGMPRVFN